MEIKENEFLISDAESIFFQQAIEAFAVDIFHFKSEDFGKRRRFVHNAGTIDDSAFFKCSKLVEVKIPTSVKHIGKWVFHGCNSLQVVEFRHDPEFIGDWIINRAARIRCYRGSAVDAYCQKFGFTVEYLED